MIKDNFFLGKEIKKKNLINITFGAENLNSKYKGLDFFLNSLNYIDTSKYKFNFFGKFWDFEKIDKLNIKYKYHGYISSPKKLRKIYSMTDIFVACSIEDAFPKLLLKQCCVRQQLYVLRGLFLKNSLNIKKMVIVQNFCL